MTISNQYERAAPRIPSRNVPFSQVLSDKVTPQINAYITLPCPPARVVTLPRPAGQSGQALAAANNCLLILTHFEKSNALPSSGMCSPLAMHRTLMRSSYLRPESNLGVIRKYCEVCSLHAISTMRS